MQVYYDMWPIPTVKVDTQPMYGPMKDRTIEVSEDLVGEYFDIVDKWNALQDRLMLAVKDNAEKAMSADRHNHLTGG